MFEVFWFEWSHHHHHYNHHHYLIFYFLVFKSICVVSSFEIYVYITYFLIDSYMNFMKQKGSSLFSLLFNYCISGRNESNFYFLRSEIMAKDLFFFSGKHFISKFCYCILSFARRVVELIFLKFL